MTAIVAKSTDAKITSFEINNLGPKVVGVINEEAKTITLEVPFGTNFTKITPTIAFLAEKISPNTGVETDFTQPVVYTVTPEEGATVKYTVTVFPILLFPNPVITSISTLTPTVDQTITIKGNNFSTLDDTRIRVYTYNSFEQAWVPFGFDLKPKAVRGTTEVDIVLQGFSSGDQVKIIVNSNGKGSALSEVIKIQ